MKKLGNKKRNTTIFQNRIVFIILTILLAVGMFCPAFNISGSFKTKSKEPGKEVVTTIEMKDSGIELGNFLLGSQIYIPAEIRTNPEDAKLSKFPIPGMFVPGLLVSVIISLLSGIFMIIPINKMDKSKTGKIFHYLVPSIIIAICCGLVLYYSITLQTEVMEAIRFLDFSHTPSELKTVTGVYPILGCLAPIAFIALACENVFKKEIDA